MYENKVIVIFVTKLLLKQYLNLINKRLRKTTETLIENEFLKNNEPIVTRNSNLSETKCLFDCRFQPNLRANYVEISLDYFYIIAENPIHLYNKIVSVVQPNIVREL